MLALYIIDEVAVRATKFENGIVAGEIPLQMGTENLPQRITCGMSGKSAFKVGPVLVRIVTVFTYHLFQAMRQS